MAGADLLGEKKYCWLAGGWLAGADLVWEKSTTAGNQQNRIDERTADQA